METAQNTPLPAPQPAPEAAPAPTTVQEKPAAEVTKPELPTTATNLPLLVLAGALVVGFALILGAFARRIHEMTDHAGMRVTHFLSMQGVYVSAKKLLNRPDPEFVLSMRSCSLRPRKDSMSRTTLALLLATAIIAPLKAQVGNAKDEKPAPSLTSDQERNIEAYISLMRADLRKEKARVMGQVMDLDSEQSSKFWPIYLDFEKELTRFYDDVADAIKDYSARFETLTDNDADHLATLVLNLEQRRNDLKRTYYEKFKAALDPVVAMKFLQIENQIERIIDLQIASGLPIAERGQQ